MTTDLFVKSHAPDYGWLRYALRSIDKFCTGFRKVVLVAPTADCPRPETTSSELFIQPERQPGYSFQMVAKCYADIVSDADHIVFHDSDCLFTQPVTPETFLRDGKIMWNYTPWEHSREDERNAWVPVMTKFMRGKVDHNFMTRHPFVWPRWLFRALRDYTAKAHGMELLDYIMAQASEATCLTFSEFNCAGAYAWQHQREHFHWLDTTKDEIPPTVIRQFWSRGGITDEIKAEMEAILA